MTARARVLALFAAACWAPRAAHAQAQAHLAAIDPVELAQLRTLIDRGPVFLPRAIDHGADASSTLYVRVRAPLATVHGVIATPEQYPSFIPALGGVQILSRSGRQAAFRFRASAALFAIDADAIVRDVSPRRVDFTILHSDLGPSSARWDLFSDGDGATIVALTVATDPGQASWLLREAAGSSALLASSVDMTVDAVLGLAVMRRAEVLAGARLPQRLARVYASPTTLRPPPPGPWMAITHDTHVVALVLDADGALVEATAIGWTRAAPERFVHRFLDVARYEVFWPWMHAGSELARTPSSVRYTVSLGAPLAAGTGACVTTIEPGGTGIRLDGVSGDFAGEHHRWDVYVVPGDGTYAMYTSTGADLSHAPRVHRAVIDREPWAAAGMAAYWTAVMVRYGVWGLI